MCGGIQARLERLERLSAYRGDEKMFCCSPFQCQVERGGFKLYSDGSPVMAYAGNLYGITFCPFCGARIKHLVGRMNDNRSA